MDLSFRPAHNPPPIANPQRFPAATAADWRRRTRREKAVSVFLILLAGCGRTVRHKLAAALRALDRVAPPNRWGRYPDQPPPSWFKQPPF